MRGGVVVVVVVGWQFWTRPRVHRVQSKSRNTRSTHRESRFYKNGLRRSLEKIKQQQLLLHLFFDFRISEAKRATRKVKDRIKLQIPLT